MATADVSAPLFQETGDGQYRAVFADLGIEFTVDFLHRERWGDLKCELTVSCGLVGARAIDGVLSSATFNLSTMQARSSHAKLLAERSRAPRIDWLGLLEHVCLRVLAADRAGAPSISLRDVPDRGDDDEYEALGLRLPKAHPTIVFGDGGSLKSYLALKVASGMATHGVRVGYFDWELDPYTHRRRLEQITGPTMPDIRYVRCDKPLIHEVTRLRRVIHQDQLTYAVFDSIGFGTQGPPEAAESAMDYCRALRQLKVGSLLIAHITKGENGDQRPFGSVFWHNSARATWNLKRAWASPEGDVVNLAAFHRKSNLHALQPAHGIGVRFEDRRVSFDRMDVATIDEVAESLPLWQRIRSVVKAGPQTLATIASELNYEKVDSLDRIVRKHKQLFTKVEGRDGITRIALVEKRAS